MCMKITRAKLEALVDDLIQRTLPPVRLALKAAGVSVSYWKQQARGWEKQA